MNSDKLFNNRHSKSRFLCTVKTSVLKFFPGKKSKNITINPLIYVKYEEKRVKEVNILFFQFAHANLKILRKVIKLLRGRTTVRPCLIETLFNKQSYLQICDLILMQSSYPLLIVFASNLWFGYTAQTIQSSQSEDNMLGNSFLIFFTCLQVRPAFQFFDQQFFIFWTCLLVRPDFKFF